MSKQSQLSDRIGSFTTVPNRFIDECQCSPRAKWLFVVLRHYTNNKTDTAFPSYDELEIAAGMNRRDIAKSIRELIDSGWVERRKRYGQSNVYTTTFPSASSSPVVTTVRPASSSPVVTNSSSPVDTLTRLIELDSPLTRKKKRGAFARVTPSNPEPCKIPLSVKAYQESAHRYPNKTLWAMIDSKVGETEDSLSFFKQVVSAYIGVGWNPANVLGQLEFFERGEIPTAKKKVVTTKNGVSGAHAIMEMMSDGE